MIFEMVSIIVPVKDRLRLTRRCLESVLRHSLGPFELIVIDNASRAPTRRYLEACRRAGSVILIRNARNKNFAASINQGLKRSRGSVLVWLNNDAAVGPEWSQRLARCLQKHPRAAAAGPCSGSRAVADIDAHAAAWSLRFAGRSRAVRRLSGFCLALKRSAFKKAGLLDERFQWGEEDEDYCLRLRLAGCGLLLAQDVFVEHERGATRGAWSARRRIRSDAQNRALFARKWTDVPAFFRRDVRDVVRGA